MGDGAMAGTGEWVVADRDVGPVADPCSAHRKRHPLGAILGLAVCAMLCGARSLYAISQWGRDQGQEVSEASGVHSGTHPVRVHAASGVQLWVSDLLVGYRDWPHLAQVCRLERIVRNKNATRRELAYAVTSLPSQEAGPDRLLALWRGHWGIENRVHWVRDVTLDEDRSQVRTGSAPQIMAALRNLTISVIRLAGENNIAAALCRCAIHPSRPLALIGAPLQ